MMRFPLKAMMMGILLPGAGAVWALDAHVHGSGTLTIAVEDGRISMALEAPGADIVGFEHAAASADDRAAVDDAISDLARPLGLFVLPGAAGCSVIAANVELTGEAGDDHSEHTEFHAEYMLECGDIGAVDQIEFAYFTRFPNALELDVQLATDAGASAHEVERDAPVLDLRTLF